MRDLNWLQIWTELVSTATTAAEFGKKLVHSSLTASSAVGAHIYQLDTRGHIEILGGYGLNPLASAGRVFAWDDHPIANAIKSRELVHELVSVEGEPMHVYVIAMMRGDEPLGAAVFSQREEAQKLPAEINAAMAQVLGLWLVSLGLNKDWSNGGKRTDTEPNPQALTDRQLKILELMSRGKTNAEIAQELILSESSIRQETVRIYRALGVGTRSEAAQRAIHLGILHKAVS